MKRILSIRFSKAVKTYNRWAIPQRRSALMLASMLDNIEGGILDVGCGTGFLSKFLNKGYVIGIDISLSMAKFFASRYGVCVLGDAENMPFADKSFDWAISNFSLHWTDLSKSLNEMVRVSRKGLGVSLPINGSLEKLEFPFPEPDYVMNILEEKGCNIEKWKIDIVDIPFEGMDLIRFFHYTGTSYNPLVKPVFSRSHLRSKLVFMTRSYFRVLFFLCKIKS